MLINDHPQTVERCTCACSTHYTFKFIFYSYLAVTAEISQTLIEKLFQQISDAKTKRQYHAFYAVFVIK